MQPRIYTYKITFIDTPYYYYGVHKERYFDEYYMGSPKTHKWCWEFYEPDKQILEFFEFSDEGWLKAQEIEKQLIKPFYNTDKWCLNENCGGMISLQISRDCGIRLYENKVGIHAQTLEDKIELGKKGGLKNKENGTGIFSLTPEQRSELGRKNGLKNKKNSVGIFSLTHEQKSELSILNARKNKENGTGIFSLTPEQRSELGRKNGLKTKENGTGVFSLTSKQKSEIGKQSAKKTNSQRWECLETGHISNSGPLTNYQKARGIDTSKRRRIA